MFIHWYIYLFMQCYSIADLILPDEELQNLSLIEI